MSSEHWEPHDSHLEREGEAGADAVDAALKKYGLSVDQILTSRDPQMDMVRNELRRENMPAGFLSWQIPAYLRSKLTHFFIQTALPGAILPAHAHEAPQFRIVLSGGVLYNGIELVGGDWIYTPKGASYSLSITMNPAVPAIILYAY